MENLIRDWKTTLRKHRQSLATFVTSVFILAAAAGTNAAIYSLADSFYVGSGSDRHADVYLVGASPADPREQYFYRFNARLIEPLQEGLRSFSALARVGTFGGVMSNIENPRRLEGLRVGVGSTQILKIEATRGRTFTPADYEPGAEKVLLVGHHVWTQALGGREDVVGRVVHVNGISYRVVGVLPEDFAFKHDRYDVVAPSSFREPVFPGGGPNSWLAGRLRPGVTPAQARAEVRTLQGALAQVAPQGYFDEHTLEVKQVDQRTHTLVQTQIRLLLTTGTILLVIAAANLCSIALLQLTRRRAEYATRIALGASRWHIVRLFALENSTVVLCGYVLAVFFGYALLRITTTQFVGADWGVLAILDDEIHLSWRILVYTFAACALVLVLLSLTTLALSSSGLLATLLREDGRGLTQSRAFRRIAHGLRFLQVSATCIALVAGGFFLLSMQRISNYDYGYAFDNIMRVEVDLPTYRFMTPDGEAQPDAGPRLHGLMAGIADAVRQVPRVSEVAVSKLEFPHWGELQGVRLASTPPTADEQTLPQAKEGFVGPGFLELVALRKMRGELFSPLHDRPGGEPVVVINEAFAQRYLGGDPLGQVVEARGERHRVIGVVSNVRRWQYESGTQHGQPLENQAEPAYYLPASRDQVAGQGYLFIRAPAFDAEFERSVRAAIRLVDADVVVSGFTPLRTSLEQRENSYQLIVFVQALLAGLVWLLACVAVYSAVSHSVAQRRREIGIRLALGATPGTIRRGIVSYTLLLAVPGTLAGLAIAWVGLVRLGMLRNQLHLVDTADARIYLASGAGLVIVALLAGLQPALKAAGMVPSEALHDSH